jgi:hypothetical protein
MTGYAEAAERRSRVLALRVAGVPPEQIAKQLNITAAAVRRDLARALNEASADTDAALEMERLEAMERATWTVLRRPRQSPDDLTALQAVDTLLRIHEQRTRTQLFADAIEEARSAAAEAEGDAAD